GIIALLVRLRRKVRGILIVRGVFLAAGTALIALLAALGTDALFAPQAPVLRWGLTLAVFGVALVATFLFLVRPAFERVTIEEIARVLEVRHPELKERLSNALDIMRRRDSGLGTSVSGVSEELLAETLKSAEKAAANIRPAREFVHSNWWKYGSVAALPILICCVLAMFFPDQLGRLMGRVFNPVSEQGGLYASRMTVMPGDAWVREGEPLIIALEVSHPTSQRAELLRLADGADPGDAVDPAVTREAMTLVESDAEGAGARFMIKFPAVSEAFEYQAESGIGTTESYRIDVRKWPQLEGMEATFDYPEYTKLEAHSTPIDGGLLAAPIGTAVTLEARYTEPLAEALLQLPRGEVIQGDLSSGAREVAWKFLMEPGTDGEWRHAVRNEWEMETRSDPYQISAQEDASPEVFLLEPDLDRVVIKSDGKLKLGYEVSDDFGVGACRLEIMRDRGEPLSIDVDVEFSDRLETAGEGEFELDLAPIGAAGAKRLVLFMRVWDERPPEFGDAQWGDSRPLVVDLDHTDGPLRDPLEDSRARKLLDRAIQELRVASGTAQKMNRGLRQGDAWLANRGLLNKLEIQIARADGTIGELAEEFDQLDQPSSAEIARDISSSQVQPAGRAAKQIPSRPLDRQINSTYVVKQLAKALERLEGVPMPADAFPSFASPLAQLVSLVDLQKLLAALAAEQARLDPGTPMSDEWRRKQQELARLMQLAMNQKCEGPP
ncbi:MAG: hypothetical protein ACR2RV_08885, partial [Verrucomicrobiales bacterium]